ncbi:hypothetical protein M758_1G282000 [Ceratodon purpureus]|uniref:Wax synthase domain-containing protein n=1 Tax=Ceratodon purpureus TaxID=3225 RepID=A0A8T0JE20_CERPU|nr:hypothetical protein KC19_1G290500 [Ceratodon purpureus]KAG0631826.1 hypothetical protein M758_1G282000 [Ceratodon purpureus]
MALPGLGYEAHTWKEGLLVGHVLAWIAAAYCYYLVRKLPVGIPRLVSSIPVLALYALLPLIFNRFTHLVGLSSFFCILTWIGSSKVLQLCWSHGPGYDPWVAASFPRFAIVMTYPAHVKRTDTVVKKVPVEYSSWWNHVSKSEVWYMLAVRSAVKVAALAILLQLQYSQRRSIPLILNHLLLSIQLYLFVTIVLEVLAAIAMATFGITIEPHFDNPFAAASLGEFWGRRWNLLVSNVLRETVYNPLLYLLESSPKQGIHDQSRALDSSAVNDSKSDSNGKAHGLGSRQRSRSASSEVAAEIVSVREKEGRRFDISKLVAMLASFLVSGLMHELLVYYATLEAEWKMMSFFVLQGIAVALESTWKLYHPSNRLPRLVTTVSTLGFAFATGHLLFWPPLDGISEQVAMEIQKMLQG